MYKVLIITYYWPPGGGPGVQRCLKLAKYLPGHGVEPVVITVDPKKAGYPVTDKSLEDEVPSWLRVIHTSTREPFNAYRFFFGRKNLPRSGFANEGKPGPAQKAARFLRGNLFVPDARKGWKKYALKACRRLIRGETFDAVITSSPPHSTQLIGLTLSREFGIPWVADLRDPWTDLFYNKHFYRLKPAQKKDAAYEKMVLEQADYLITVSESLKNLFLAKSSLINSDKIHVIPNGYDPDDFPAAPDEKPEVFTISYVGTMTEHYPVSAFIQAIETLLEKKPTSRPEIRFLGQVSEPVVGQLEASSIWPYVDISGYIDHPEAIKVMMASSVLLLIIPNVPNNEGILTGKLFEYLAAKRPVMGFGPNGSDAGKIISDCESGGVFGYHEGRKAGEWLTGMYDLYEHHKEITAGNENIMQYSRESQAGKLAGILTDSIKNSDQNGKK
ncbi:MAG: glycosyltransferase family 4 protein [Bacteroidota bacterium]